MNIKRWIRVKWTTWKVRRALRGYAGKPVDEIVQAKVKRQCKDLVGLYCPGCGCNNWTTAWKENDKEDYAAFTCKTCGQIIKWSKKEPENE